MSIPGLDASSYTIAGLRRQILPEASARHVHEWGRRDWLIVTHASTIGARHKSLKWLVLRGSLECFLLNPETWHTWKPATIRSPLLRDWAINIRASRPASWLSVQEYASLHGWHSSVVRTHIREGRFSEGEVMVYARCYYLRQDAPFPGTERPHNERMPTVRLRAPLECIEWYRQMGHGNVSRGMRAVWERMREGEA